MTLAAEPMRLRKQTRKHKSLLFCCTGTEWHWGRTKLRKRPLKFGGPRWGRFGQFWLDEK